MIIYSVILGIFYAKLFLGEDEYVFRSFKQTKVDNLHVYYFICANLSLYLL